MSKRPADSTAEKAAKRRKLADEVLVEAARNGDTPAVRAGLEKLSTDAESKRVAFDAVHEACRGNHDECLALLLPYVETTQMGFGTLLSECVHADHTACTEVLLQHWKSVCRNVAFVSHGQEVITSWYVNGLGDAPHPCPAMWADPAVCQVLIDAGADIETKDDTGRSPLQWACRFGDLAVVTMLVEAGAGVCVTCNRGNTCLMFAARHGHTETVRYLVGLPEVCMGRIENSAAIRFSKNVIDHASIMHVTALLCAQSHPDVVEVLVAAGADVEVTDVASLTLLMLSCRNGELSIVKMLVEAGARVCTTDAFGRTCLLLAAACGWSEIVRYLVGVPGVDMSLKDKYGYTVVHIAAQENRADVVEVLIDAGADIEAKDDEGCSPLLVASENGHHRVVEVLVRAGAGVCVTDKYGKPCLTIAAVHGHTETVRTILCMPEVDVNQSPYHGFSSLHSAVVNKHSDVMQVIIAAGADLGTTDDRGSTPLHSACEAPQLEVVEMLVEAGADMCAVDDYGCTCLMFAAHHGLTETVRYLAVLLREVDVNHSSLSGRTALFYAREEQHADVVQVLLENGAEE